MLGRLRNEEGFWSIIGVLLACAVIAVLVVILFGSNSKIGMEGRIKEAAKEGDVKVKPGQSTVGAVMDTGKATACQSNLRQIRMYLQMEQQENGQYPAALEANKVGSGQILVCPQTLKAYAYDPNTGKVSCTTPGHESF